LLIAKNIFTRFVPVGEKMLNKITYSPYICTSYKKNKPQITVDNSTKCTLHSNCVNPSFGHHPDFDKLNAKYQVTASSFFRRGNAYGSASDDYVDIEKAFKKNFCGEANVPKQMLICGIANSQEPFSYLATIKDLKKEEKLVDILDLHTIDLQSRPVKKKLFKDAFLTSPWEAEYALSSFVEDKYHHGVAPNCRFRVNDEIFKYLQTTYNNPKKSLWETRLQDAIKKYEDEKFDVVSINNTLYYIEKPEEIFETLRHVYRILKPNGIFITDPNKYKYMLESEVMDNLKEIMSGIYQKTNQKVLFEI